MSAGWPSGHFGEGRQVVLLGELTLERQSVELFIGAWSSQTKLYFGLYAS